MNGAIDAGVLTPDIASRGMASATTHAAGAAVIQRI